MFALLIGIIVGAASATVYWMRRVAKLQAINALAGAYAQKAKEAADTIRKA